jgi:hypothetical protein
MTVAISPNFAQPASPQQEALDAGYLPRSIYTPVPFLLPLLLTGMSVVMGGSAILTDLGFICLTAICICMLVNEFAQFPRRFGIGGMVMFGGILLWFCYDYLYYWMGLDFNDPNVGIRELTVARSAFYHCLFALMMAVGLLLPFGRLIEKLFHIVPEPTTNGFYFWAIILLFMVGLSPYFLFTVEPWYESIWLEMSTGRAGGATWEVGRTGNVNYNWGAYIATFTQIGQVGGQLAVFYALLIARNPLAKIVGWAVWLFWVAIAFGSGTRGYLVFNALPGIALIFLKHQAYAATFLHSISRKAYTRASIMLLAMLFAVQFQAYFRETSYAGADVSEVSLTNLHGTSMFTEGLMGFALVPKQVGFFYNRYPGEILLRPIPQTVVDFFIGPIPRALWTTKPIDPVWKWYNEVVTQSEDGTIGTTVAQGLVGGWYFRYGVSGVIQGGLLFGLLLVISERALQNCQGRTISILITLGFATWLFRCYRLFNFHELYPLLIGVAGLWLIIRFQCACVGR